MITWPRLHDITASSNAQGRIVFKLPRNCSRAALSPASGSCTAGVHGRHKMDTQNSGTAKGGRNRLGHVFASSVLVLAVTEHVVIIVARLQEAKHRKIHYIVQTCQQNIYITSLASAINHTQGQYVAAPPPRGVWFGEVKPFLAGC